MRDLSWVKGYQMLAQIARLYYLSALIAIASIMKVKEIFRYRRYNNTKFVWWQRWSCVLITQIFMNRNLVMQK